MAHGRVSFGRSKRSLFFVGAMAMCAALQTSAARADLLPPDACPRGAEVGDLCETAGPDSTTAGTCQPIQWSRSLPDGQVVPRTVLVCVDSPAAHRWRIFRYLLVGSAMLAIGWGALVLARRRKR